MTDEQIKLNAEVYACPENSCLSDTEKERVMTHFITGAHSRDEEIKELKKQRDNFKDRLLDALEKRDQLRNPWISIEDRLPDDMQKVIWVRSDGQYFFGHFHNHDNGRLYFVSTEEVTDVTGEWRDRVTHWMPIPSLKGE